MVTLLCLLDQLAFFWDDCYTMCQACSGTIIALGYHLGLIIIPEYVLPLFFTLKGPKASTLMSWVQTFMRWGQITNPFASMTLVLGACGGALQTYFMFLGGCEVLRNICIFGCTVPVWCYVQAMKKKESGSVRR
jgi:hypothetical protein